MGSKPSTSTISTQMLINGDSASETESPQSPPSATKKSFLKRMFSKHYLAGFYYAVWKKTTKEHWFMMLFNHHKNYTRLEKVFVLFAFIGLVFLVEVLMVQSFKGSNCETQCSGLCPQDTFDNYCNVTFVENAGKIKHSVGCNVEYYNYADGANHTAFQHTCVFSFGETYILFPVQNYIGGLFMKYFFLVGAIEKAFRKSDKASLFKNCCRLDRFANKLGLYLYLVLFGATFTVGYATTFGPAYYFGKIGQILLVSLFTDFAINLALMIYGYSRYVSNGCCGCGPGLPIGFSLNYNSDSALANGPETIPPPGCCECRACDDDDKVAEEYYYGIYTLRRIHTIGNKQHHHDHSKKVDGCPLDCIQQSYFGGHPIRREQINVEVMKSISHHILVHFLLLSCAVAGFSIWSVVYFVG